LSAGKIDAFYRPVAMVFMVIVFWYYLIAAIRLFKNRQTQITGSTFSAEQALVAKWTRVLLITMTLIAAVWAATIFSSVLFNIDGLAFFAPIEIILVIFVYWIGLRGYQLTRVVYISEQKATKTYAESLGSKEVETCIDLLREAMENDKLFLDPSLTVNKLAEKLDLNPRTISAVLNRELKKGFSEFINEYRVKEVKEKMLQPANKHITIAGIAFESGFNSVATFQRTFKSIEHVTPKQFLAVHQNTDK
jgi:AraC-like DNA-binding protein